MVFMCEYIAKALTWQPDPALSCSGSVSFPLPSSVAMVLVALGKMSGSLIIRCCVNGDTFTSLTFMNRNSHHDV